MSSRVQRGVAESVQPVIWRHAGSRPATESPRPGLRQGGSRDGVSTQGSSTNGSFNDTQQHEIEAETQQLCRQAHARGKQEAEAAAEAHAQAQIADLAQRMARSIEEVTGLRPRLRHEAEKEIVALALAVARRVLHRELTVEPDAVLGLLKVALEKLDIRELHRVRVHPETALLLGQQLEKIGIPQRVELIADQSLERGALILESGSGSLDASVETQLAEIERGFADLIRRTA